MNLLRTLFTLAWFVHVYGEDANTGYFWHVTDMHWDPTYADWGGSCGGRGPTKRGIYGDFACDSPWSLIESAIEAMAEVQPQPDFLIWTGDDTPHIYNDTILNQETVYTIIDNLTTLLDNHFPNSTIFAALGNHDWSPKNQFPGRPDPFYDRIADRWGHWLRTADAKNTFRKGGYYKAQSPVDSKLWIVNLNTNIYYESDKLTADIVDPADQFKWLRQVLKEARAENAKTMFVAHVPPGMFEKHRSKYWYYPKFNEEMVNLLQQFSNEIGSAHFAHHHTDSFRIVQDSKGSPVLPLFIAPAVTPWETTLPGVIGGAGNNPGIRLVQYDRHTGAALNIMQYFLNLTQANDGSPQWTLAYDAKAHFKINDLSARSMSSLAESFKTTPSVFDKYYAINGLLYNTSEKCVDNCMYVQYCAITELDYDKYEQCVKEMIKTGSGSGANRLIFVKAVMLLGYVLALLVQTINGDF